MLTLSLLRHAKSSWDEPSLDDFDRPLAKRGQKAAPEVGAALAAMGLRPDVVLCSAARRARETLDIVLAKLGAPAPAVLFEKGLYMADPATMLTRIRGITARPDERAPRHVMLVGHNPGLEELALMLVGSGADDDITQMTEKFPTAGVAVIAFNVEHWSKIAPGSGRLEHFLTPKRLP